MGAGVVVVVVVVVCVAVVVVVVAVFCCVRVLSLAGGVAPCWRSRRSSRWRSSCSSGGRIQGFLRSFARCGCRSPVTVPTIVVAAAGVVVAAAAVVRSPGLFADLFRSIVVLVIVFR